MCAWLCPTLCDPVDCSLPGSSVRGNSPGKDTGVGCYFLLQGIFPTPGSNSGLLYFRWTLYHLNHQGSPKLMLLYCRMHPRMTFIFCTNYFKIFLASKASTPSSAKIQRFSGSHKASPPHYLFIYNHICFIPSPRSHIKMLLPFHPVLITCLVAWIPLTYTYSETIFF